MVNPYPARIRELHDWLAARYCQTDTQGIDILLAAMLPQSVTRVKCPWIILETDYPSRDTFDGWFNFGSDGAEGELPLSKSLVIPRVLRRRFHSDIVHKWVEERPAGTPSLFVEPEWRRLPFSGRHQYSYDHIYAVLLSQCIRLRVVHPRGDQGMRLDRTADKLELARLTRRVIDCEFRQPIDPTIKAPSSFLYWCELLQRIAPQFTDWEALTGQIAAVARGISLLYSDGRPPDWTAAERVIRDSIPYPTYDLLDRIANNTTISKTGGTAWSMYPIQDGPMRYKVMVDEFPRLLGVGILTRKKKTPKMRGFPYSLNLPDIRPLLDREKRILL